MAFVKTGDETPVTYFDKEGDKLAEKDLKEISEENPVPKDTADSEEDTEE